MGGMSFSHPIGPWRRWFAWFPVQTYDDEWVWLITVERQRRMSNILLDGPTIRWWDYRRADDTAPPGMVPA
jgi:hypothetical protein